MAPSNVWTCPACGVSQPDEFSECPVCGIVVAKYKKAQPSREEKAEEREPWHSGRPFPDTDDESDDDAEAESDESADSESEGQSEGVVDHVLDWISAPRPPYPKASRIGLRDQLNRAVVMKPPVIQDLTPAMAAVIQGPMVAVMVEATAAETVEVTRSLLPIALNGQEAANDKGYCQRNDQEGRGCRIWIPQIRDQTRENN